MRAVHAQFRAYMDAPTWFSKSYPDATGRTIAYFSTEFGIDVGLPIYSGGLGVLAGDHLKSPATSACRSSPSGCFTAKATSSNT